MELDTPDTQPGAGEAEVQLVIYQKYNSKDYTVTELYSKLSSIHDNAVRNPSKAGAWEHFRPVLAGKPVTCQLQCKLCSELFSSSNPTRTAVSHIGEKSKPGACRFLSQVAVGQSTIGAKRPAGPLRQTNMFEHFATPEQQDAAAKHLAAWFYKKCIPFNAIEDPDLRAALAAVGAPNVVLSRKQLAGPMLDAKFNEVRETVMQVLAKQPLIAISTDGWKKSAAENAVPLINFMALLPMGGSHFLKIKKAGGVVKDAEWVRDVHVEAAKELLPGGKEGDLLGVLMDNTSTNRKALRLLKAMYPKWLTEGCSAHGLSLYFKDLSNEKKCPGTAKVFRAVQAMCLALDDSEHVKALLKECQKDKYGEVKGIQTHVPTRFAILHLMGKDLLRSEDAIRTMVSHREWEGIAKGAPTAAAIKTYTLGGTVGRQWEFWPQLKSILELTQPLSDAIHQIEADAPLLSQLRTINEKLQAHAAAWAADVANNQSLPDALAKGVVEAFKSRLAKHYSPSWTAAYLVDPIHAVETADSSPARPAFTLPFSNLTATERESARQCLRELCDDPEALQGELMTLRLEGLPEDMSELVPALQRKTEVLRGKKTVIEISKASARRNWWASQSHFPQLAKAAMRLLSMHTTSCACERNWSLWGQLYTKARSSLGIARAEKLIFIKGNDKAYTARDIEVVLETLDTAE